MEGESGQHGSFTHWGMCATSLRGVLLTESLSKSGHVRTQFRKLGGLPLLPSHVQEPTHTEEHTTPVHTERHTGHHTHSLRPFSGTYKPLSRSEHSDSCHYLKTQNPCSHHHLVTAGRSGASRAGISQISWNWVERFRFHSCLWRNILLRWEHDEHRDSSRQA